MSQNKWERRDNKRNARKRMKVDGASTRVLQRIILEKANVIPHLGKVTQTA